MNWIDRPGIFRGHCTEAGIEASEKSSSVGLRLVMRVTEWLDQQTNEWTDWSEYDVHCSGTLWIIGTKGTINETAAKMARDVLGWNGSLEQQDVATFKPCQFTVNQEDYNGQARFKIGFLNEWDYKPTARTVDAATAKSLQAQHGSKLRAFFGAKSAAVKPPAGKPASPPPRPVATAVQQTMGATPMAEEDIPFNHDALRI